MVITNDITLPTDEELTVQELNLSTSALRAGAFHLGKQCENQNNEFMLCRQELDDPRACLSEGKAVTNCALDFFRKVKKTCHEEFLQYATCLDKSSGNMAFGHCRNTQGVFDKCVSDNLGIDRPDYGYFTRAKIHSTEREAPPKPQKKEYPDATPGLPDDYPRPPAKYGARFHWLE
ncbi:PREDICTED: NADH dehydrogenase [ubiquinone] 1 alpha subcomplex subunit 8 [Rhagoletis zephyria]|uniref:NADH dehydrogenase [ubiquinone] 1 alpha subcomplex subunit 8 n=1 Tax=Rhagoletis zephyria TaxID=28612 RepID=UPI0008118FB5|nr:PREDICTED: NADH dehydrogenase [ubiquinone] 1 alpha subcomplex subunit 8 [Rhagoletis zephyria]XP_036330204.1 NADH dehydrogenase [ubiquinone] 1 alpha subcomplex subunit 8 [Rhagoletis pomonella]